MAQAVRQLDANECQPHDNPGAKHGPRHRPFNLVTHDLHTFPPSHHVVNGPSDDAEGGKVLQRERKQHGGGVADLYALRPKSLGQACGENNVNAVAEAAMRGEERSDE